MVDYFIIKFKPQNDRKDMANITSEDCKDFLVEFFNNKNIETHAKDWKRTSKYKENGVWHRNFLHDKAGEVIIIENQGSLSIKPILVEEDNQHRKFTMGQLEAAKNLVQEYTDNGFAYCHTTEQYILKKTFMASEDWKENYHAIAGLFTFSFPDDTYDNDVININNGIDTFMKIDENKSFTILFLDQEGNVCENYEQEILKEGFLPSYTEFLDQYHIAFNPCPDKLTVGQTISYLESLGLVYRSEECLFKNYAVENILPNANNNGDKINDGNPVEAYNLLRINDSLNKILEHDNVIELRSIINNGLDINTVLVNKNKLCVEAFKNNAYQCIAEILNHKNLDLWLVSEGYNPEGKSTVASEILEILNYNAHKYTSTNYTQIILDNLRLPEENAHYYNKCDYIINSVIKNNKLHPFTNDIINKMQILLPEENFNTSILSNFTIISNKFPDLLEKTLSSCSVGVLSNIIEQHALTRDYKVVLFLLDKKLINPQNVIVQDKDLKTFMALDINNYQKDIQKFIKDNVNMLSVTYQKKDKKYANELESMKSCLNLMYGVWQHINPTNKLKK